MKILTAMGNPVLNEKLKKLKNFYVVGKDILYQEGVIEALEDFWDIDCIIINNNLPGEIGFYELIKKIKNIKSNIEIYVLLEEKDEDIENYLMSYQIYQIYYLNEIDFNEFIKIFLNNKSNLLEGINKEINEFKKLILKENVVKENYSFVEEKINESFGDIKSNQYSKESKQTNKNFDKKSNENILEKKQEYYFDEDEDCKTIAISGNFGAGKSLISVLLSKVISKQNKKTLLIDFDMENSSINTILGTKKYNNKNSYIEDYIINIDEKLDILCGIDRIVNFEEINNNYLIKEIVERLKRDYDFIIIDVSSRIEYKYVKIILTYCDKIIFLIEPNLLEISKSNRCLEVFLKDFDIDVDKIKIVFNKSNKYKIADDVLEEIFSEFEILESIEYKENYSLFINKNTNINFDEIKFEKIYKRIIKKKEEIYANTNIRN